MPRYRTTTLPADHDGMRECARANRCTNPRIESEDGKTTRLPALTPRAFCESDRIAVRKALSDLPLLFVRTRQRLDKTFASAGGDPVVSMSKSAPVLLSLSADELVRRILTTLVSWEERVRAVARLTQLDTATSRRRRDGTILAQAYTCLAAHLDVLLALPEEPMMRAVSLREASALPPGTPGVVYQTAGYADVLLPLSGADAGLELLDLVWRCKEFLGDTAAQPRHLPGIPCDCGYCELYEYLDADGQPDGATCRQCGNDYTADAYADLTKEQADTVEKSGARRRTLTSTGDDLLSGRA